MDLCVELDLPKAWGQFEVTGKSLCHGPKQRIWVDVTARFLGPGSP